MPCVTLTALLRWREWDADADDTRRCACRRRPRRLPLIDAARGVAVLAMVVYHFSWDLRYFGYIAADVETRPRLAHLRPLDRRHLPLPRRRQPRARRRGAASTFAAFLQRLGIIVAARRGRSPSSPGSSSATPSSSSASCITSRSRACSGSRFCALPVWLVMAAAIALLRRAAAPWPDRPSTARR